MENKHENRSGESIHLSLYCQNKDWICTKDWNFTLLFLSFLFWLQNVLVLLQRYRQKIDGI